MRTNRAGRSIFGIPNASLRLRQTLILALDTLTVYDQGQRDQDAQRGMPFFIALPWAKLLPGQQCISRRCGLR